MKHRYIIALLVVAITLFLATGVSAQERTHNVQPGDTLSSIAEFYDSSVEAIAAANGIIDVRRINVGQSLIIPAPGSNVNLRVGTYTVQNGDRLVDIATRYNTTVEALQQTNSIINADYITPGQVLRLPATGGPIIAPGTPADNRVVVDGSYTVQEGDTLFSISRSFNVNMYTIASANGIYNLNLIYIGQSLAIPGY